MYNDLSSFFAQVKDKSAEDVCEFIGGKVQENNFKNCCAVRMSYAFNKAGIKIPYIENETVSGAKKNENDKNEPKVWYIFRVRVFKNFLENKKYTKYSTNEKSLKSFKGKKGVIVFDVNFKDATGHIDLFNGSSVEGSDYTNKANNITLYEI